MKMTFWVLTNANGNGGTPAWTSLNPSGTAPAARGQAAAIYDPTSNRMTIFGGQNCFSTLFNDTWVLTNANGLGGTPAWTQLATVGTPPSPREISSVGYDPATNRMIVFSGGSSAPAADVWVLTNANGLGGNPTWIQLSPAGTAPVPRVTHSTVYDPTTNTLIVFGGETGTTPFLQDTWVSRTPMELAARQRGPRSIRPARFLPPGGDTPQSITLLPTE